MKKLILTFVALITFNVIKAQKTAIVYSNLHRFNKESNYNISRQHAKFIMRKDKNLVVNSDGYDPLDSIPEDSLIAKFKKNFDFFIFDKLIEKGTELERNSAVYYYKYETIWYQGDKEISRNTALLGEYQINNSHYNWNYLSNLVRLIK